MGERRRRAQQRLRRSLAARVERLRSNDDERELVEDEWSGAFVAYDEEEILNLAALALLELEWRVEGPKP